MSEGSLHIRIIKPNNRINDGAIVGLLAILKEIYTCRGHIKIVFKEQFVASYRNTGLGLIWNILLPLVPLSVYWFLSKLRVFPNFEGVDSATFITFGVTLWFLFVGCIQTPIRVIHSKNNQSMKTSFPLSASIVSDFAQLLFDTLVRFTFVIFIVILGKSWPEWSALFLPIILFPAFALFIGVGLMIGIINVIYLDFSRVINIVLQYGIFISGVLFPIQHFGFLTIFNAINPFAIFISFSRNIFFEAGGINWTNYTFISLLAFLIFIASMKLFYSMEYRLREIS